MQQCCSVTCSKELLGNNVKKEIKKEVKKKVTNKTESKYHQLKLTQTVFNEFIRLRDRDYGCISCGNKESEYPYHAGHYKARGSHPELRFDEDNVHKQCMRCNTYLSGNLINYRKNLLDTGKLSEDTINRLEGVNEKKKYTIEDLKKLRSYYRGKIKELMGE